MAQQRLIDTHQLNLGQPFSQEQNENMPPAAGAFNNSRTTLTEEQKERMLRNRQIAEEKRRQKREMEASRQLNVDVEIEPANITTLICEGTESMAICGANDGNTVVGSQNLFRCENHLSYVFK